MSLPINFHRFVEFGDYHRFETSRPACQPKEDTGLLQSPKLQRNKCRVRIGQDLTKPEPPAPPKQREFWEENVGTVKIRFGK